MSEKDFSSILFSPEEIGNQTAAYLEQRRANKGNGLVVGLDCLDKPNDKGQFILPMNPGELMGIIARPGNGKTGFMVRWARHRTAALRQRGIEDRAVVYITLEQSVEELNAFNLAADRKLSITNMAVGEISDSEWIEVLKDSVGRRFHPLWNVGYSSMTEKKQITVDMQGIIGALNLLQEKHKKIIDTIFVDYLQRIPYMRAESKTVGISDNLDKLKTLALRCKSPVIVGVQATREVDDKNHSHIPQLDDGQWTSNIEQTCDRVISLVRPITYRKIGEMFNDRKIEGPYEMLVSILKQKLGPTNFSRWVFFQPEYNKLDQLERRLP